MTVERRLLYDFQFYKKFELEKYLISSSVYAIVVCCEFIICFKKLKGHFYSEMCFLLINITQLFIS